MMVLPAAAAFAELVRDERDHRGESQGLVGVAAIGLARVVDRGLELRLRFRDWRHREGKDRSLSLAFARELASTLAQCVGIERRPGRIEGARGFVAALEERIGRWRRALRWIAHRRSC